MTNRRNFLAQAGMLSAAMLLKPTLNFAAAGGGAVGLQLYSLRDQLPKDVKGVIAQVAKAGYKEVETFGYDKQHGYWGLKPRDFKQLLKSHGLTTPSGHYGIDEYLSTGKTDDLKSNIEVVKTLGQTYLTVPYLDKKFRKTPDDLKRFVEKLNKVAEIGKQSGIKVAYHNHNFEFENVGGTTLYETILKEAHPSLVTLEMDIYWVVRAGHDPIKLLQEHPNRFKMVHVKDMDKSNHELNTEVGKGTIDYKKIIPIAKKAGVTHFIMEQENFTNIDPYKSIAESSHYMKSTLMI